METVNFYTDNLKIKCFKIRNVITSACIENSDFNVSIYWYLLSTHVRVDNFSNFKFPKSGELKLLLRGLYATFAFDGRPPLAFYHCVLAW